MISLNHGMISKLTCLFSGPCQLVNVFWDRIRDLTAFFYAREDPLHNVYAFRLQLVLLALASSCIFLAKPRLSDSLVVDVASQLLLIQQLHGAGQDFFIFLDQGEFRFVLMTRKKKIATSKLKFIFAKEVFD